MTAEELLRRMAMETGERILCIDESRIMHQPRADTAHGVRAANSIAIVPLMGSLYPRGQSGMEGFRARLASAVANPDVGAIAIDTDSPGGTYAGTPETGAAVADAAAVKPVTAVVDSLAASAAYYAIAQPGVQIVVSPSADVGSIGVLSVHMDISEMLKRFGVNATITRSTPFKAEGNPFEPLTPEAQDNIKAEVMAAHEAFIRSVATGRRTSLTNVRENFGQGRTVGAHRAVDLGMADRVGTMADVLGGARTKHAFRRRSAAAFY